uniref:Thioredoxin domain-containing protein n=1 Tax=Peronospora matthiolae TaxID=2874970 RepID=A0AAV1UH27_9STRA
MARGQAKGAQSSAAREMKMFLRNRMWYEHRHWLTALAALVVALFGAAFVHFFASQDHIYRLEVTDSALMARVFRSGKPWVVLCSGPNDVLPEVFDKVSSRLAGKSFVGVLDCKAKLLASGKSVLKRYSLKTSISPTVFIIANGERPKQVGRAHLSSAAVLAKHVEAQLQKTMQQVQNSAQLEARCLSRTSCVLLLRGGRFQPPEKQWIHELMHKHPAVSFVWIDSTSLTLSLEKTLPEFLRGEHRMVLFRRQRDLNTQKKGLAAKAYRGDVFDAESVGMFLDDNIQGDSLKLLVKSPKVLHRKKTKKDPSVPGEKREGGRGRPKRKHHPRHDDFYAGEEKSDDDTFPQHVELDGDGQRSSIDSGDVEEDGEVLDLDAVDGDIYNGDA